MQAGDMADTVANVDDLIQDYNYQPTTNIKEGVAEFVKWYRDYYKV